MKYILIAIALMLVAGSVLAQGDSTKAIRILDMTAYIVDHENEYVERVDTTRIIRTVKVVTSGRVLSFSSTSDTTYQIDTIWAEHVPLRLTKKQHEYFMDWLDKQMSGKHSRCW